MHQINPFQPTACTEAMTLPLSEHNHTVISTHPHSMITQDGAPRTSHLTQRRLLDWGREPETQRQHLPAMSAARKVSAAGRAIVTEDDATIPG